MSLMSSKISCCFLNAERFPKQFQLNQGEMLMIIKKIKKKFLELNVTEIVRRLEKMRIKGEMFLPLLSENEE